MTTVVILPEPGASGETAYRAISGERQPLGKTAGAALDALAALLPDEESGTLAVIQDQRPDRFFTAAQQERLQALMERWRAARDAGTTLTSDEQAELRALVEAEVRAATERARALVDELQR